MYYEPQHTHTELLLFLFLRLYLGACLLALLHPEKQKQGQQHEEVDAGKVVGTSVEQLPKPTTKEQKQPKRRWVAHQMTEDYVDFASNFMLHTLTATQSTTTILQRIGHSINPTLNFVNIIMHVECF